MAHKAKPKKKTQEPLVSTITNATTIPKAKPKSTTKPPGEKQPAIKVGVRKSRQLHPEHKDSPSYSPTQHVITTIKKAKIVPKSTPNQLSKTQENDIDNLPIINNYKPEWKPKIIDPIGPSDLTMWKKSSGRSKSWSRSKRSKLPSGEIELLIQAKTIPVTLGWNFSAPLAPSTFLRSYGTRPNSQPEGKQKRTSYKRISTSQQWDLEYEPGLSLPRGYPSKRPFRKPEEQLLKPIGGYPLRITIGHQGFTYRQEIFLKEFSLKIVPSPPKDQVKKTATTMPTSMRTEHFSVVKLLRNESHADVYLVHKVGTMGGYYHAHHFLSGEGLTGNWATYAKRNLKRLQSSSGFYGFCIQEDGENRKIVVMQLERTKPITQPQGWNIKSKVDFPPLSDVDVKNKNKAKPPKLRVSYAAVAGRKKPRVKPMSSNHPAFKAWEDRNGKDKKPRLSATEKKAKKKASEKTSREFKAWVEKGKKQNCPLRSKFDCDFWELT